MRFSFGLAYDEIANEDVNETVKGMSRASISTIFETKICQIVGGGGGDLKTEKVNFFSQVIPAYPATI